AGLSANRTGPLAAFASGQRRVVAEERVGKGDVLDMVRQPGVEPEVQRHVDLLATLEGLLDEAEALDLAEVGRGGGRVDVVDGFALDQERLAVPRHEVDQAL